jgi:hypothetical protein
MPAPGLSTAEAATANFEELLEKMADNDEDDAVTISDVVGKLAPNLLAIFGASMHVAAGESLTFTNFAKAKIVSLPATLVDVSGGGSGRPFVLIDAQARQYDGDHRSSSGGGGGARTFVAMDFSEAHTDYLAKNTLVPLEVRLALLPRAPRASRYRGGVCVPNRRGVISSGRWAPSFSLSLSRLRKGHRICLVE